MYLSSFDETISSPACIVVPAACAPVKPLPSLAAQFFFVPGDIQEALWVTFAAARWPSAAQSFLLQADKPEVRRDCAALDLQVDFETVNSSSVKL